MVVDLPMPPYHLPPLASRVLRVHHMPKVTSISQACCGETMTPEDLLATGRHLFAIGEFLQAQDADGLTRALNELCPVCSQERGIYQRFLGFLLPGKEKSS